jgi:hypothetical protein
MSLNASQQKHFKSVNAALSQLNAAQVAEGSMQHKSAQAAQVSEGNTNRLNATQVGKAARVGESITTAALCSTS